MSKEFEQISIKPGFMKHNGGVLFRTISENEYEFKSIINENHLNAAGITHGGYLSALIDLNKTPPLCFIKPGLILICSNSLDIIFYNKKVKINKIIRINKKKYITAFSKEIFIIL